MSTRELKFRYGQRIPHVQYGGLENFHEETIVLEDGDDVEDAWQRLKARVYARYNEVLAENGLLDEKEKKVA